MKIIMSCIVMIFIFVFLVLSLWNFIVLPLTLSGIKEKDKSFKTDILEHLGSLFLVGLSLFLANFISTKFNLESNDLYNSLIFIFGIFIGILIFVDKLKNKKNI